MQLELRALRWMPNGCERDGDWLRLLMAGLDLWIIRAMFHTEEE
jgi:hypothetical protein